MHQGGYIALVSVIIIGAILTLAGIALTVTTINGLQISQSRAQSDKALNVVEACAEEALMILQDVPTLPATITTPLATCALTVNSQSGTTWDFTVSGSLNGYFNNIRITAERNSIINLSNWQGTP